MKTVMLSFAFFGENSLFELGIEILLVFNKS